MAYKVVRVRVEGWRDKFEDTQDDTDFAAGDYPALDAYLCAMEERGWTVASTSIGTTGGGFPTMYITLHSPDPPVGGVPAPGV